MPIPIRSLTSSTGPFSSSFPSLRRVKHVAQVFLLQALGFCLVLVAERVDGIYS